MDEFWDSNFGTDDRAIGYQRTCAVRSWTSSPSSSSSTQQLSDCWPYGSWLRRNQNIHEHDRSWRSIRYMFPLFIIHEVLRGWEGNCFSKETEMFQKTPLRLRPLRCVFFHRLCTSPPSARRLCTTRGKSGPALGGTEYQLMPSACRLIVRAKLWNFQFRYLVSRAPMRRRSIVVV